MNTRTELAARFLQSMIVCNVSVDGQYRATPEMMDYMTETAVSLVDKLLDHLDATQTENTKGTDKPVLEPIRR